MNSTSLVPVEVSVNFFDRDDMKASTLVFIYCPFLNINWVLISYSLNEYGFVIQLKIDILKILIKLFLCENTTIYRVELPPFQHSLSMKFYLIFVVWINQGKIS